MKRLRVCARIMKRSSVIAQKRLLTETEVSSVSQSVQTVKLFAFLLVPLRHQFISAAEDGARAGAIGSA